MGEKDRDGGVTDITWGRRIKIWGSYRHYMGEKDRDGGVTDITWGRRIKMGELQTLHGGEG